MSTCCASTRWRSRGSGIGTNCQNQPEAHLIAQVYRALLAIAAPAVLLKAEAIVAPSDLLPYLGVHAWNGPSAIWRTTTS